MEVPKPKARPPSAVPYDVPSFQNQDDVNLYIVKLISENEALKRDLTLTAEKWKSNNRVKTDPVVKRSQLGVL